LKAKVRGLLETLVEGGLETRVAAVAFQGYGVLLKAVEIERRVKDTEEIDQKLEEMRERLDEARREKYGDLGA